MRLSIRRAELEPAYDVIVVGAGVGGLVCGGFLARAGRRVLVLDHHYLPGGYCTAFPRKKYQFDAAVHHIGGCGRFGIVGQVMRRLDVRVPLVRLDPMDHLVFPRLEFRIPAELAAYEAALTARFPAERERVAAFFGDLVRLYRQILSPRRGGALIERYRGATFQQMLADYFADADVARIVGGQWGYLGSPVDEISAVGMCQMLVNYLKDGAYYPIGSTQAFSNALVDALLRRGGHVLLRSRVTEILVDGGRAAGVRLEDGRALRADCVVGCIDARQLFFELLPAGACEAERERIRTLRAGPSYFGLYLAVSPDTDLSSLPRGFYHFDDDASAAGAIDWIYLSVTTDIDPGLAPGGHRIISATVGVRPDSPHFDAWQRDKTGMADASLRRLGDRVPGLSRRIEFLEAASPRTLARFTLARDGAAYGWAVIPDQAGNDRFSQQTSLAGLCLAGQWTAPGPGVCAVAASGWMAANRITGDHNGEVP